MSHTVTSDLGLYFLLNITKTYLYNFDPIKSSFNIVKLGFTGVYIIFLFLLKNIDCWYLLELPQWGSSNEYPQSMFYAEIWKISAFFYLEIFIFLVVKFSIYLNRHFRNEPDWSDDLFCTVFLQENICLGISLRSSNNVKFPIVVRKTSLLFGWKKKSYLYMVKWHIKWAGESHKKTSCNCRNIKPVTIFIEWPLLYKFQQH